MVLTGSLRRRILRSNRRRLRASKCGRRKTREHCEKNSRCTWKVGRKRSFCRKSGNRRTRRFDRYNIFRKRRRTRRHRY